MFSLNHDELEWLVGQVEKSNLDAEPKKYVLRLLDKEIYKTVVYDCEGIPRCPKCGAELDYKDIFAGRCYICNQKIIEDEEG